MSFDPTKPAEDSPLDAAEMRDQLNGLKALIDAQQSQIAALQSQIDQKASLADVTQAITAASANNVDGFDEPDTNISDPPQTVEVAAILGKLDDLISALKH
jgi:hypothetical protein